jgi:hypothetical protein
MERREETGTGSEVQELGIPGIRTVTRKSRMSEDQAGKRQSEVQNKNREMTDPIKFIE